jgi:hypothetical protein
VNKQKKTDIAEPVIFWLVELKDKVKSTKSNVSIRGVKSLESKAADLRE